MDHAPFTLIDKGQQFMHFWVIPALTPGLGKGLFPAQTGTPEELEGLFQGRDLFR